MVRLNKQNYVDIETYFDPDLNSDITISQCLFCGYTAELERTSKRGVTSYPIVEHVLEHL